MKKIADTRQRTESSTPSISIYLFIKRIQIEKYTQSKYLLYFNLYIAEKPKQIFLRNN